MKKIKKWCSVWISAFILFAGCLYGETVHANEDAKLGNVYVQMEGQLKECAFCYVKVADWKDGEFQTVESFSASQIDWEQITTAKQLSQASQGLLEMSINPDGNVQTDQNGSAKIEGLEPGMYLVYGGDNAENVKVSPMLFSVPVWSEDDWSYDVSVCPKVVVERQPVKTGDEISHKTINMLCFSVSFVAILMCLIARQRKQTG